MGVGLFMSFAKRSARTKLKDKLESEGVSGEALQAVRGRCSLSVPRHTYAPHPAPPLRATECDTLPPPRRDVGREGTQRSQLPFGAAGCEMLGRTGGCDARCWGAAAGWQGVGVDGARGSVPPSPGSRSSLSPASSLLECQQVHQ